MIILQIKPILTMAKLQFQNQKNRHKTKNYLIETPE